MDLAKIVQQIGEPYYEDTDILIFNMDCRVGIDTMRATNIQIDATITSPPYNIGKEYESVIPATDYIDWLSQTINAIYDITSPNGACLLNLGYFDLPHRGRAIPIPYLLWDKINFYLNQEIVWNYGAGVACKHFLSPRNEKILWYVRDQSNYVFNLDAIRDPDVKYPNQKKNGKLRCNTLGKNPSDVWQIAKVTSGTNRASEERTSHPAQFPTDLINRMIAGFTAEDTLVMDPFLGSGTTAISSLVHGRKFIGFELKEEYCHLAKNRVLEYRKHQMELSRELVLFP